MRTSTTIGVSADDGSFMSVDSYMAETQLEWVITSLWISAYNARNEESISMSLINTVNEAKREALQLGTTGEAEKRIAIDALNGGNPTVLYLYEKDGRYSTSTDETSSGNLVAAWYFPEDNVCSYLVKGNRKVLALSMTPFGWVADADLDVLNTYKMGEEIHWVNPLYVKRDAETFDKYYQVYEWTDELPKNVYESIYGISCEDEGYFTPEYPEDLVLVRIY